MALQQTRNAPQQQAAAAPRVSRMGLDKATMGRIVKPFIMVIYGPEGVGKTSLALDMEDAILLDLNDGSSQLNLQRFPRPEDGYTLLDVHDAIDELRPAKRGKIKTLVIDTATDLEGLIVADVLARSGKKSIEDFGFGKGYQYVLDEFRAVCSHLERLRDSGVNIVVMAHSVIETFKNPEGDDYDRWTLSLHKSLRGFLKQWAEIVLFARFEEAIDDKGNRSRGVFTGARILHTRREAAYDAKNRHSLPEELPLDWTELVAAMKRGVPTNPAEYRAACEDRLAQLKTRLPKQEHDELSARIAKAEDAALPKALDYLNGKLR